MCPRNRHQLGPVGPRFYHTLPLRIAWGRVLPASQRTEYFHYIAERMLEIFLVLALLVGLAKKPTRRRRRFNLRAVRIRPELSLLTLASDTVLTVALTGAGTTDYRMMSVDLTYSLKNLTAGEGPIMVGLAHSDYTVAEIKEYIDSVASISQGLKIEQERSRRLIRIVGTFVTEAQANLNHGEPIKTRLNWLMAEGGGNAVNAFVFNMGTAPLTTGSFLNLIGTCWVKD